MVWVVVAWAVAVALALVVLGYAAFEATSKVRRVRRDLTSLQILQADLTRLAGQVEAARHRVAAVRSGG